MPPASASHEKDTLSVPFTVRNADMDQRDSDGIAADELPFLHCARPLSSAFRTGLAGQAPHISISEPPNRLPEILRTPYKLQPNQMQVEPQAVSIKTFATLGSQILDRAGRGGITFSRTANLLKMAADAKMQ